MSNFSTYFKNKNDKNDFYIAIGVIVLFLGSGLFYGFNLFDSQQIVANAFESDSKTESYITDERSGFQFENEEDKTFTTVLLKDNRNIEKVDNWLETNQDTLGQIDEGVSEHLSIQEMIDSIEANKKAKTTITETQPDTTNTATQITLQEDTIESLNNNNTTIPSPTKEKTTTEEIKETKKKEVDVKKPVNTPSNKNNGAAAASSNCVIVVGAFSLSENADKLKRKLIKKGYPAYTFFRKGNKVVGIKQSCKDTVATQKMLKLIQKEYNPSAWVLKNK